MGILLQEQKIKMSNREMPVFFTGNVDFL